MRRTGDRTRLIGWAVLFTLWLRPCRRNGSEHAPGRLCAECCRNSSSTVLRVHRGADASSGHRLDILAESPSTRRPARPLADQPRRADLVGDALIVEHDARRSDRQWQEAGSKLRPGHWRRVVGMRRPVVRHPTPIVFEDLAKTPRRWASTDRTLPCRSQRHGETLQLLASNHLDDQF